MFINQAYVSNDTLFITLTGLRNTSGSYQVLHDDTTVVGTYTWTTDSSGLAVVSASYSTAQVYIRVYDYDGLHKFRWNGYATSGGREGIITTMYDSSGKTTVSMTLINTDTAYRYTIKTNNDATTLYDNSSFEKTASTFWYPVRTDLGYTLYSSPSLRGLILWEYNRDAFNYETSITPTSEFAIITNTSDVTFNFQGPMYNWCHYGKAYWNNQLLETTTIACEGTQNINKTLTNVLQSEGSSGVFKYEILTLKNQVVWSKEYTLTREYDTSGTLTITNPRPSKAVISASNIPNSRYIIIDYGTTESYGTTLYEGLASNYSTQTLSNLIAGTKYYFRLRKYTQSGGSLVHEVSYELTTSKFEWDTTITAGSTFSITAAEWNRAIDFINSIYNLSIAHVTAGQSITATLYNNVANALNITSATAWEPITANHFIRIQNAINT